MPLYGGKILEINENKNKEPLSFKIHWYGNLKDSPLGPYKPAWNMTRDGTKPPKFYHGKRHRTRQTLDKLIRVRTTSTQKSS